MSPATLTDLATRPTVRSVVELIGNTPMLELTRMTSSQEAAVFAKLELCNPGGSVKDRLGLGLILGAEASAALRPGGTVVEPTAGNTGIGLAVVGLRRGYQAILVMPAHFSREKQSLIEALGATVVRTPSEAGMEGAIRKAHEIAAEIPGGWVPQQFDNPDNPAIHYRTTGPEIWQQMDGRIDAFVAGVGSGGTFTGVARFLKEQNPSIWCVAVEPNGSILQGGAPAPRKVEGIGVSFIPNVLDLTLADEIQQVVDRDITLAVRELTKREGLLIGGSSGANCEAALRIARRLGVGRRVVTVFPDGAERYLSKGLYDLPSEG